MPRSRPSTACARAARRRGGCAARHRACRTASLGTGPALSGLGGRFERGHGGERVGSCGCPSGFPSQVQRAADPGRFCQVSMLWPGRRQPGSRRRPRWRQPPLSQRSSEPCPAWDCEFVPGESTTIPRLAAGACAKIPFLHMGIAASGCEFAGAIRPRARGGPAHVGKLCM